MVKTLKNTVPATTEEEEFYTVEKILDKRKKGKRVTYLVKWQGYSDEDNTWEPVSNLKYVKFMIADFEKELQGKIRTIAFG